MKPEYRSAKSRRPDADRHRRASRSSTTIQCGSPSTLGHDAVAGRPVPTHPVGRPPASTAMSGWSSEGRVMDIGLELALVYITLPWLAHARTTRCSLPRAPHPGLGFRGDPQRDAAAQRAGPPRPQPPVRPVDPPGDGRRWSPSSPMAPARSSATRVVTRPLEAPPHGLSRSLQDGVALLVDLVVSADLRSGPDPRVPRRPALPTGELGIAPRRGLRLLLLRRAHEDGPPLPSLTRLSPVQGAGTRRRRRRRHGCRSR